MTVSEKQRKANQRNALKSTGPRTEAGKERSKYNALKHGLTAKTVLLPDENREEFEAFAAGLYNDLKPVGSLETLLVDRIIFSAWRLFRLRRVEAGIHTWHYCEAKAKRATAEAQRYTETISEFDELFKSVITDRKAHDEAMEKAREAVRLQNSEKTLLGQAFIMDCALYNTFGKLTRYEATISKALYTALRELTRLQNERLKADSQMGSFRNIADNEEE